MMDWGYGAMAWWGWLVMVAFWAGVIVLVVWAVAEIFPRTAPTERPDRPEPPEDILDRRLAAGEIDAETYKDLRAALRGNSTRVGT